MVKNSRSKIKKILKSFWHRIFIALIQHSQKIPRELA